MELAPGLHRIGNDLVAAYLVITADGVTVVDAGLAGHYRELRAELRAAGRDLDDVRGVVLTHGDTDHLGFAERLRVEAGVPVYVHEADAARARGEESTGPGWRRMRRRPTVRLLAYAAATGGPRTPHPTAVTAVRDGD